MWWLKRYSTPHLCARYLMLFCSLGFVLLPTSYVWANPAGEQVVGGAATFQRDGNTLTVNQATDRLAVNWQSFNIAAGERTHFNMPSSTSAALNRVIGGNPSSIYGSLSANGILYLINPSGILVGPGGTVNAAAFMASTLDVSTEQFMNAKTGAGMNFYGSSGESIINQGNITAEKGDVFLIAQKVENRGTINAANGTAGMVGSGQNTDVMVHEVGGKGFAIRVAQLQGEAATGSNRDLPDGEELLNEGTISAAQAELNASGNVYALAIRNSGTIRAKAVVANADGTVRLDGGLGDLINTGKMYAKNAGDDATAAGGKIDMAGQNITASPESIITAAGGEQGGNGGSVKIDSQDTTIVQGRVDVAAPSAGAKGGKVQLLGERVGLLDGAKVDASGGAGGGTVLVGGDYLGGQTPSADLKNLANQEAEPVKNAKATVMANTAEIKADATVDGDGGKIILWSDEYTGFYGDLFARGGVEGGNGGFIETSSKNNLQAFGSANASAVVGHGGMWLLDPANVTIAAVTANGAFSGGNPNVFTPTADSATINAATIATALTTANVIINTEGVGTQNGDIILTSALSVLSAVTGNETTLTLNAGTTGAAGGTITINNTITGFSGNKLNVVLNAAGGAVTLGNFAMTTQGGSLAVNAGGNVNLNGAVTTGGGQISVVNTLTAGSVTLGATGSLTSGGGNILINTGSGGITLTGATSSGSGNVNLNVTGAGAVSIGTLGTANGNLAVAITGNGAITQAGAITTGTGLASFTTAGAVITLGNAGNLFGGAVSLRNTGGNAVSLLSNSALVMGTVNVGSTLGLGFNGNLTQLAGTIITTAGVTTLTATGANRTVNLAPATGSAANSFGANFLFSGASNIQDFSLRNSTGITITELSELSSLRNLAVTFDNGNMTLPTFSASGNVALTTSAVANTINLNNVSVGGNFTVAAGGGTGGAISQTANTTIVTGPNSVTTLSAGSGGIVLAQNGNDFKSTVNLSTAAGGLANITDLNAIVLGAVSINGVGALTVTADSITQATTGSITTGSGAITMNGQTGVITLANSGNNFGTSTLSLVNQGSGATTINYLSDLTLGILNLGSGGLTVTSSGNLNLGTGTVAGPMSATASNANITQGVAGLTVTGLSTLAAGSGNITLASSGNTFGNVTINSATDVNFANAATTAGAALFPTLPATLGNLTLSFANSLTTLPGLVTTVNLTVISGLNLTQSAALTVGGAASFNSTSGSIDLTTGGANNNFGTSVALTTSGANNISITDVGALILGNITMSALSAGTLSVNAGGNLTQSVGTSITTGTGAVTLNLGSAGNIILDNVANSFNGNVNFTGSYNDITVRDSTSFAIQSGLNVPGNFSLTVLGGNSITQLGALSIAGTGSFTASNGTLGGSILLTNASNNFGTFVNLTNLGANDISIRDVGTLVLGSVSMAASAGALTVQAGGNLTQLAGTSIIAGTGAVSLTANAGGSIILTEATNNFRGNVTFSNGLATISLLDTSSFQIQNGLTLAAGGNFTLTADGISQAGSMSNSTGITTLTSTGVGNDIVLASAANDFATVLLASGRDATIVDANSVNIGTSDVTRDLAVTATAAGGDTIVNAPVTVGRNAVFTAGTTGLFQVNTTGSNNGSLGVTGNATVTSSTIELQGVLAGANVFLLPSTDATTVGINTSSTFSLTTSELLNIVSGGTVTVGRTTGTSAITVGDLGAFDLSATSYDLTLEGLTSAIAFNNGITMGNGRTLNLAAGGAITSGLTGTDITIGDGFNSGILSISSASTVGVSGNALSTAIDQLGASTLGTTFLSNSRALQTTGAIGVTGDLDLTTGGTVSQTTAGSVTVSGVTAITVPTATDVLLAEAVNNFGALTLTASGGPTFRDLELNNISTLASVPTINATRNVALQFDNAGIILPALTLSGTLDVLAGGGAITQAGVLQVTGNASFSGNNFEINLSNSGNIFNANVSLNTTGLQNATLVDSTALVLGTSNVSALLNLTSGGSITQSTGTTLTTGAGVTANFISLTPLVGDRDLLLTGLNSISGQVAFGGALGSVRDVSIQNSSTGAQVPVLEGLTNLRDLTLNYTGVTPFEAPTLQGFAFLRNISFSAVGPMTQKSGGISNLGTAAFTVTGAGNAITLDDALNNFGTSTDILVDKSVSLNTNNGDGILLESSGLVLGASNLGSGDLSVTTTAGTTTQTGIITASLFDINAGGSVNLTQSNLIDTVAASVAGAGNSFSFANAQSFSVGTVGALSGITTASGDVTVSTTASGASGIITVNNTIFAGGLGSVFINAQSGGDLDIFANVGAAGAGTITLLAEDDLSTGGTGVLIGSVNTGAIVISADSAQSGTGTLTIAANDIVGSTLNSSNYTLSGADLDLAGIVRQSGVGAKISLTPTLATGTVALGVNTAGGDYDVAAGELLNIQSAGTVVVGGSNFLGAISLGDLNLVGNVFKNFLLQSSPGGLTTVGNAASAGTFSLVSSGVNVEIDSRVQLFGNVLNISTTGGNNSAGANVVLQQEFLGGFDPATTALLNGGLIVDGGTGGDVKINASLGLSQQLGLVSISGDQVEVNAIGTNGGVISLMTGTGTIRNNGNLNSTARENGVLNAPPAAGSITLRATGAGTIDVVGNINAQGAQGANVIFRPTPATTVTITQSGGAAGNVTLSAPLGTIQVGGAIIAYGGDAVVNSLPRGSDGTISIDGNNVGLTRDQIAYYGTKIDLKGRNNLIFASQPDYANPTASVGGASIIMNQLENGTAALNDPTVMQNLAITYGETGAGQLYMGSGSSIQMFGGKLSVDRITAPTTLLVGGMTLGEIYTTGRGISSGSVRIGDQEFYPLIVAPVSVNYIDTSGGNSSATSTSSQSGISGGSVTVYGSAVRIGEVNTTGSSPLSTARVPAIGGTGGSLSVNATTVSILGNLSTSGGVGAGATGVRSTGGSGGEIRITAPSGLTLDSVNLSTPTFVFDSSGSTGVNGGLSGSAGKINLAGPIGAAANGVVSSATTAATSLDLRFSGLASTGTGSVVTLGTTSSDTIILGTLITAGGSGVTRGTFTVNGALQVDTLSTAAQPYSIAILGNGSVIQNRVTFLNSGTATIGSAGVTTTFTDGFDAQTGATVPSALQLGGTINTVTANTGSMLTSATQLIADTTLNSAGNIIDFGGTLDGSFNLTLASGVAGGRTTFNGAVGDTTEVGQITITGGVDSDNITPVNFLSTVKASGITSGANSNLTFNNDVTLSDPDPGITTDLGGTITFNNQAYLDGDLTAILSFLGAGNKRISGATTLSGGPIEFGGSGSYTVTIAGSINGAQNLTLSGLGAKTFTGIVGGTTSLGTGTGAAISMSGGNVSFGKLTTASGIVSSANVVLTDTTTLAAGNTGSSLTGDVDLLGATLTSAGTVDLGDSVADSVKLNGTVLVNGAGAVTVKGAVTDNAGFTSFTQGGTAGKISFDENVTLDVAVGVVTLNGNVGLSGMIFDAAGTVIMGDALTDSITLSTAAVTLTGTGSFAVNGVVVGGGQNLTLSGAGGKTFAGAASGLGTLALTAGAGTFNSTVSGVSFNQSGGVAVLNGNGTFTGVSTLGGTSTTLNGISFSSGTTAVTGVLTSTGTTTITGGLITLNTASAVTSSSGVLTMGSAVALGQGTTLSGAGAYKLSGTVNGANSLTLSGGGAKTFSGAVGNGTALSTITQNDASGLVTFNENVTMSGAGTFNANLILDGLNMTSTGSTLTIGSAGTDTAVISGATTIQTAGNDITLKSATTLNAALTMSDLAAAGGITTISGAVSGKSSNLTITTDDLVVGNTVQTGSGVVSLTKKDGLALTVGGVAPGFLNATEISRISTSGGLTVASGGNITINQLVLGDTDQITGAFRMVTTGGNINVAESVQLNVFGGSALAGALTATGSTLTDRLATQGFQDVVLGVGGLSYDGVSSMSLSGIQVTGDILVSSADAMTVNGSVISGTGDVALESLNSNLNVLGTVTSASSMGLIAGRDIRIGSLVTAPDAVFVDAGGYFINSYSGNPFQSADVRVATTDLFGSNWPSNGAVPGLQVVYGVSDAALVQANQIGVSTTLLAGNGAPYILEFTTGTGQPYIFAQQAAIPPVMLPAALTGGNGFAKTISYSADEIEMMTPEERSAYENQQRQVSARVILQGQSGEGEEIGAPAEGRTPQAAIPAVQIPVAPTAQVLLEGKPLAGAKSDQERGDAKRILKVRPTRAVAVRSGLNVNEVMESERMAAEVSVGSAPVVQSR